MNPLLDVGRDQLDAQLVADLEAVEAVDELSLRRAASKIRTQVPFSDAPVTTASKRWPIRCSSSSAAADLRTWRSTLFGVVLLLGAVRGERLELGRRIGRRLPGERGLEQPLRDEVGKAAVGRRRVRVVAHGEAEVADRRLARPLDDVLARAHQLDDHERQVREPQRVGLRRFMQKRLERAGVRLRRQLLAVLGGDRDDPLPALGRAHDAPQRGELFGPRESAP